MTSIVAFKAAGLPTTDANAFKRGMQVGQAQANVNVGSGTPFLRLEKGTGDWVYGPKDTQVEDGSLWAVNPHSLQTGYVAWKAGKPVGKQMASVFGTQVNREDLPEVGAAWQENIGFQLQCISGEDTGTVVEFTNNSYGARKAFSALTEAMKNQADADINRVVPIVELKSDSYQHAEYGKVRNPIFEIKRWASLNSPDPEAADTPAAPEAPAQAEAEPVVRRRRRTA